MKKWMPTFEKEIETKLYKYIIGWYNHEKYGDNCFRISKFLKENGYFIGHFVIVPDDLDIIKKEIINILEMKNG